MLQKQIATKSVIPGVNQKRAIPAMLLSALSITNLLQPPRMVQGMHIIEWVVDLGGFQLVRFHLYLSADACQERESSGHPEALLLLG